MKIIKSLLKEGIPKEEIYQLALKDGLKTKKVSHILSMYPDPDTATNYTKHNTALIIIYLIWQAFGYLYIFSKPITLSPTAMLAALAISLIIPIIVVYLLYNKIAYGYLFLSFLLLKGILEPFKYPETVHPENLIGSLIGVTILIAVLAYTITLKFKLFPYQGFFNLKKDKNGAYIFTANSKQETLYSNEKNRLKPFPASSKQEILYSKEKNRLKYSSATSSLQNKNTGNLRRSIMCIVWFVILTFVAIPTSIFLVLIYLHVVHSNVTPEMTKEAAHTMTYMYLLPLILFCLLVSVFGTLAEKLPGTRKP